MSIFSNNILNKNWWKKYSPWMAGVLVVLLLIPTFAVLYILRDLPSIGEQSIATNAIFVYDRKNRLIEEINTMGEYHVVLHLKEMGRYGPDATLAAEDRHFYSEGALNYTSTARALFQDVLHRGYGQGGSTITQQLVKIEFLTPDKSIKRKIREAALAQEIDSRYSKDQILELYLNKIYYGHHAYGLGAATKTYFGQDKNPSDLTIAQAAFLAGLVNAPSSLDPKTHYDLAKKRQEYVLSGLVNMGKITQAQADIAGKEDIKSELKFSDISRKSKAPHFVDYVLSLLEKQSSAAAVQQGGFNIYTTLDLDLQASAQKSVTEGVSSLNNLGVNNGMLLAADAKTGEILAWVGSSDYQKDAIAGQYDLILAKRQPGSSFKPYVYESAFKDRKITMATLLEDRVTDFGGGYKPLDFDNAFQGKMNARTALLGSRNVPAVEVGVIEGISNVNNLAHRMGINSPLQDVASTAIGSSEVTMLEHLQGYQVFAHEGLRKDLFVINKITDASNNILFEQKPLLSGGVIVLTSAEAYLITDVLKDYSNKWGLGFNRMLASKSGTSGGAEIGVHPDAWKMAYNSDIVIGTWAGNTAPNGGGAPTRAFGTNVGSNILAPFTNSLPANMNHFFSRPDGIVNGHNCPSPPPSPQVMPTSSPSPRPVSSPPTLSPTAPDKLEIMLDTSREIFLSGTVPPCPPIPSPTLIPSPSPSPSPSISPSPSPMPSPSSTPTITITPLPSPASTPSPIPTPSTKPSPTPCPSPSLSSSPKPSPTPCA